MPVADGYLTIGPFNRRVGVSIDLLRAWERRYGIPRPRRAQNGHRLYTDTKKRHGKTNPAKAAVARKILIASWHVLARREPFKPSTAAAAVTATT